MTRVHCATIIACLGLPLTGCLRAPEVELTGVRVGGVGFRGATLVAELQIYNPNRLAIETDSITFKLDAAEPGAPNTWTLVTAGTYAEPFRIDKESTASAEIPIEFAYSRLSTPVRSIIETGRLNYRISGQVFVRRPLPKRVPFSEEGSISLFASTR